MVGKPFAFTEAKEKKDVLSSNIKYPLYSNSLYLNSFSKKVV